MPLNRDDVVAHLSNGDGSRDLSGMDLSGADLSRLDLRGANLSRADLSTADLRWAVLEGADLHSSVLRRADCRWAIMRGANLRQADLARANFGWADITGADLTGAQLEGANLDSVDLRDTVTDRAVWRGATALPAMPERLALPRVGAVAAAAAAIVIAVLINTWGWLWKESYFGAFDVEDVLPDEATAFLASNFGEGLTVLTLTLKALLVSPLALVAFVVLALLWLSVPALFVLFGDQVVRDLPRPDLRTPVLVLLFLAYGLLAWVVLWPITTAAGSWLLENAVPNEQGLGNIVKLLEVAPWYLKLAFLIPGAALLLLGWTVWRWLSVKIATTDLRAEWRLRYPRLNGAYLAARESVLFSRDHPLTAAERRRALWAAAILLVIFPTLLTQAGAIYAYEAMCDGGDHKRIQVFTGREPESNELLDSMDICARLLIETDDNLYIFFPSQTRRFAAAPVPGGDPLLIEVPPDEDVPDAPTAPGAGAPMDPTVDETAGEANDEASGDSSDEESAPLVEVLTLREPVMYGIERRNVEFRQELSAGPSTCPTCEGGPTGLELPLIDPDDVSIEGVILEIVSDVITLDLPPEQINSFQVSRDTRYYDRGLQVTRDEALQIGVSVRAVGPLTPEGTLLNARTVLVLASAPVPTGPPPELVTDFSSLPTVNVIGSNWPPGATVALGLGRRDAEGKVAPQVQLGPSPSYVVGEDGTFFAAVPFHAEPPYPTGPEWLVVARVPGPPEQIATSQWLDDPIPMPTATPTFRPAPPEFTMTPEGPDTPEPDATNTPFPTPAIGTLPPGPGSSLSCDPDEFEPDFPRGFQQEIFVSFAEGGATQTHNFCPAGDKDLMFFRVKAGRWYRVFTDNLAPGVDTVLAVGDLSPSTNCQPAGCWNDDRAPLTYASEVIFQAVEDDVALITVDNFGTNFGTDATYEAGVQEFIPEATSTPTPPPSPTATRTPTPQPCFKDPGDGARTNDSCANAFPLDFEVFEGTIYRSQDTDWFYTPALDVGTAYFVRLESPDDIDLDVELLIDVNRSRNQCDPTTFRSTNSGDEEEYIAFQVANQDQVIIIRVYPATSADFDCVNPYELQLGVISVGSPTATSTPSASPPPTNTFTPTPTSTPSPTMAVPLPTPP